MKGLLLSKSPDNRCWKDQEAALATALLSRPDNRFPAEAKARACPPLPVTVTLATFLCASGPRFSSRAQDRKGERETVQRRGQTNTTSARDQGQGDGRHPGYDVRRRQSFSQNHNPSLTMTKTPDRQTRTKGHATQLTSTL